MELTKEDKIYNLLNSIVLVGKGQKAFLAGNKPAEYKSVTLNLPVECLEEIERWIKDYKNEILQRI